MTHDADTRDARPEKTLDASLGARLRAVIVRLRQCVLLEGMAWVIAFLFGSALVQLLLDHAARGLRWSMRAVLLAVIVVLTGRLIWRRLIRPLWQRYGAADAACLVERRYPELKSILISAVRFSAGEVGPGEANSPVLVASVIDRAAHRARDLDFRAVVDPRRARWSVVVLFVLFSIGATAAVRARELTGLWFARNVLLQDVPWPKRTHLVVELQDGVLIGARGDDFIVQAHADGVQPREVDIIFETVTGRRGREAMVTVGRAGAYRYRYTFKNAQEDFRFHLIGGDDKTETFEARLLERPHVEESAMRITPPAYTRLGPTVLGDGQRAAKVLPGSTVSIWVRPNKPVVQASLMAGRERVAETTPDGNGLSATIMPTETRTYHFALVDDVGLENKRPVVFSLRVLRDEPPRVRLKLPGVGDMITVEAILPIELEFADTYGLATAELFHEITREDAKEVLIPLPGFRAYLTTFTTSLSWPVASVDPQPGERVTLGARATDVDTVSGPNFTQAPEITLRVVTRDELLEELARREQEYRMDFERLVDAQEQLRRKLLTIMGRFDTATASVGMEEALAPLERRQRNLAGSVNVIRQQFERILAELGVNQLMTRDVQERLGDGIVEPITRLARRDMVTAADTMRQWARDATPEQKTTVDQQQVALLSRMRHVLASMIQREGYHEVVTMLRDIVRLQNELRKEVQDSVLNQASDVFDD